MSIVSKIRRVAELPAAPKSTKLEDQLLTGVEVEREHEPTLKWLREFYAENDVWPTLDEFAEHISSDHVAEIKDYYTRLIAMEEEALGLADESSDLPAKPAAGPVVKDKEVTEGEGPAIATVSSRPFVAKKPVLSAGLFKQAGESGIEDSALQSLFAGMTESTRIAYADTAVGTDDLSKFTTPGFKLEETEEEIPGGGELEEALQQVKDGEELSGVGSAMEQAAPTVEPAAPARTPGGLTIRPVNIPAVVPQNTVQLVEGQGTVTEFSNAENVERVVSGEDPVHVEKVISEVKAAFIVASVEGRTAAVRTDYLSSSESRPVKQSQAPRNRYEEKQSAQDEGPQETQMGRLRRKLQEFEQSPRNQPQPHSEEGHTHHGSCCKTAAKCPACEGTGKELVPFHRIMYVPCKECKGTGVVDPKQWEIDQAKLQDFGNQDTAMSRIPAFQEYTRQRSANRIRRQGSTLREMAVATLEKFFHGRESFEKNDFTKAREAYEDIAGGTPAGAADSQLHNFFYNKDASFPKAREAWDELNALMNKQTTLNRSKKSTAAVDSIVPQLKEKAAKYIDRITGIVQYTVAGDTYYDVIGEKDNRYHADVVEHVVNTYDSEGTSVSVANDYPGSLTTHLEEVPLFYFSSAENIEVLYDTKGDVRYSTTAARDMIDDSFNDGMMIVNDLMQDAVNVVVEEYRKGGEQRFSPFPAARLKKMYNDYADTGFVRDEAGVNKLYDTVVTNVKKLYGNSILSGASEWGDVSEYWEQVGITDPEEQEKVLDWIGQTNISEFGMYPLLEALARVVGEPDATQTFIALDHVFNVAHTRSDLAALLVEGGTATLDEIAGRPSKTTEQTDESSTAGKAVKASGRVKKADLVQDKAIAALYWMLRGGRREEGVVSAGVSALKDKHGVDIWDTDLSVFRLLLKQWMADAGMSRKQANAAADELDIVLKTLGDNSIWDKATGSKKSTRRVLPVARTASFLDIAPMYNAYADKVYYAVIHILQEEMHISEKDYSSMDVIMEEVKELFNQPETIAGCAAFEANGNRPQMCAEAIVATGTSNRGLIIQASCNRIKETLAGTRTQSKEGCATVAGITTGKRGWIDAEGKQQDLGSRMHAEYAYKVINGQDMTDQQFETMNLTGKTGQQLIDQLVQQGWVRYDSDRSDLYFEFGAAVTKSALSTFRAMAGDAIASGQLVVVDYDGRLHEEIKTKQELGQLLRDAAPMALAASKRVGKRTGSLTRGLMVQAKKKYTREEAVEYLTDPKNLANYIKQTGITGMLSTLSAEEFQEAVIEALKDLSMGSNAFSEQVDQLIDEDAEEVDAKEFPGIFERILDIYVFESEQLHDLYNIPAEFDIWRNVTVTDVASAVKELQEAGKIGDYAGVGEYWAADEDHAIAHWGQGGTEIILHGKVPAEAIDWKRTVYARIYNYDEMELYIPAGTSIQLIEVLTPDGAVAINKTVTAAASCPLEYASDQYRLERLQNPDAFIEEAGIPDLDESLLNDDNLFTWVIETPTHIMLYEKWLASCLEGIAAKYGDADGDTLRTNTIARAKLIAAAAGNLQYEEFIYDHPSEEDWEYAAAEGDDLFGNVSITVYKKQSGVTAVTHKKTFAGRITQQVVRSTGMKKLVYLEKEVPVSELIYSESPNITYTQDKDPSDFIYIEYAITPEEYRHKGYASALVRELKDMYPDKQILASVNMYSEHILLDIIGDVGVIARAAKKKDDVKSFTAGSIVVDQDGNPRPVYHGTYADFDQFNIDGLGAHFGTQDQAQDRLNDTAGDEADARIMEVYLSLKNPYNIVSDLGDWEDMGMLEEYLAEANEGPFTDEEFAQFKTPADVRKGLQAKGYDGLVYENEFEGAEGESYIVFDPGQIKIKGKV